MAEISATPGIPMWELHNMTYRLISCICGGFLLAVLWFDLMHDVVVYPYLLGEEPVSADALMTIETYYQRVVIDSSPMNLLVGFVMVLGIITNIIRLVKSQEPLDSAIRGTAMCQ